MAKQKEAWDKLSMLEKALLIKLSVDNGVSSLKLIRDTYNLYSSGGDLVHKKSGKEQNESQDLNSSWLPKFAYTPSATQSQILNVLGITPMTALELYTAQEVVKEIDNPGYTQMKQNAQKAQMLKAQHIVEENPGLLNMAESGVIDYLPVLGDAKLAAGAAAAALQGDFTEAALLGMFTILPGATDKIASKALKNITKQDRDFIKAANLYFKKYGYEPLDLNLADLGRSVVNLAIKDRINHLNTVSRGVYTIKDSFLNSILNLSVDDIVQVSKNLGINFKDVKNAFELNKKLTNLGIPPTAENRLKYSLTHIPGHTGHGRAGLTNGEYALYTSNSWGDINSVADRYSMPQWANPEIYEGAVGVLRRKFLLSPDNNRNKWFFEGDFPLLNRNNDVYPVLRYLKSHAEPNRKIEIDKDILNKVYEYVKDTQKLGRSKNKSIWNELNNTQSILKTRGFPYNIHIKNEFLLEAILDYLKNLDSPILNKKDISNIYNIIGKYKWVETPLFDKINTRQAIQLGYKKVYQDLKFVQSLLDLYFPNIWLLYVEFPIKTTEALKRAPKGVNRTLHFIFTGIPGEEPVELLEYIPTNYNKNLSHRHDSNTASGTRKTFSTGGPLYPFSFEKNPFLKTPVVRYDNGGSLNNWEQGALDRATKVYSNYELAKDNKIPLWRIPLQKKLKQLDLPSGLSNCTLTATQWVDPTNPIMSAATIFNNLKTGYAEIDSKDAIPGNLLITKNPETGGYHTMMIEGFTDSGEPILRYSNGDHTADALRTNISLSEYHSRDNSLGGNHTEDHYFRYNYPNEVFLPEITVFAKSGHKKAGNEIGETLNLDTSKVDIAAWYQGDHNRKRGINVKELELFLDSLIANNIPLALRLAILGTSAQETGTKGAASYGIGGMGLLGLSGQRMDSALVSHNPDTVGMQIHFLILDLKRRHSDNWLDGGTGGPKITTGKEGFEKFWNGTDVDTVTLILNKSYIRPAERLDAWLNRAKVAKSMIDYLK